MAEEFKREIVDKNGKRFERTTIMELKNIPPEYADKWLILDNKANPKRVISVKMLKVPAEELKARREARAKVRESLKGERMAMRVKEKARQKEERRRMWDLWRKQKIEMWNRVKKARVDARKNLSNPDKALALQAAERQYKEFKQTKVKS